jgi:glycosyltransferase involved in cell wall biosynthesis
MKAMDYIKERTNYAPFVSVVIPAHNEEKWLSACIESFYNQTYKNLEIIVVDDGSTDRTFDIIKQYIIKQYPIRLIRHEKCLGEARARTSGVKVAKGEIILHGEADAVYPLDYIEKALKYFMDPKVMAVSCGQIKVLNSLNTVMANYYRVRRFASFQMRLRGEKPTYGCHLVRREVFEKIGYYDPSCIVGCDADFALRIQKSGMKIKWASDIYFYHADPSTLSAFLRRTFKGNLYRRHFLERWNMWPRGWKMIGFLLWNIFVTLIPLYFVLLWIHYFFGILIIFAVVSESIGPFFLHKESRIALYQAIREKNFLLVLCMPAIMFLRIRAASYGRLGAIFFSNRLKKAVTYE